MPVWRKRRTPCPSSRTGKKEVLKLIAEGKTGREIAAVLYLSPNTVERHRANIMDKLSLHNRAELIKFAIRKAWLRSKSKPSPSKHQVQNGAIPLLQVEHCCDSEAATRR